MDNAFENENQNNSGQVNDNVGQDEGGQQQENSGDWESQAKYYQKRINSMLKIKL